MNSEIQDGHRAVQDSSDDEIDLMQYRLVLWFWDCGLAARIASTFDQACHEDARGDCL
jgi:hypothetical protein